MLKVTLAYAVLILIICLYLSRQSGPGSVTSQRSSFPLLNSQMWRIPRLWPITTVEGRTDLTSTGKGQNGGGGGGGG